MSFPLDRSKQGQHNHAVGAVAQGNERRKPDAAFARPVDKPLQIGDRLSFIDAAGYTMVKKNWFNGVKMPAIAVRELNGEVRLVRDFSRDTQFIVITHSRRTMEAADVLYGVTMEEAGCSRLVSVNFAEMEG